MCNFRCSSTKLGSINRMQPLDSLKKKKAHLGVKNNDVKIRPLAISGVCWLIHLLVFFTWNWWRKRQTKSKNKSHEKINTPLGIQLFGIIINCAACSDWGGGEEQNCSTLAMDCETGARLLWLLTFPFTPFPTSCCTVLRQTPDLLSFNL